MKQLINTLKQDPGINFLLNNQNVEIYIVGGFIRDYYLGKESKDIDIVIRNLNVDIIIDILEQYGKVDQVGESFGVIKYKPNDWMGESIDIALPRVDVLEDKTLGHKGIKATFDPYISIEDDLNRRDCTLNSIAVSLTDGRIIDPFDGIKDIINKTIRCTSIRSFIEDPLRMLRVIQQCSRFEGFEIEEETLSLIKEYASDIKYISGERILEELDKIYYKGDVHLGIMLLLNTGLYKEIFGHTYAIAKFISKIKTREDFYCTLCHTGDNFKTILKGDNKTYQGIKALEKFDYRIHDKKQLFNCIQISETVLDSGLLPISYSMAIHYFKNDIYPKSVKELAITGYDIMKFGYKGDNIGAIQDFLVKWILESRIDNTYEDLINILENGNIQQLMYE